MRLETAQVVQLGKENQQLKSDVDEVTGEVWQETRALSALLCLLTS